MGLADGGSKKRLGGHWLQRAYDNEEFVQRLAEELEPGIDEDEWLGARPSVFLRKAIEAELGADLTEKKLVVRAIVTGFLEDPDKYRDVGKGKGVEERREDAAKAKAAVAKAAREIEAAKPKPTKPVIVVGAGPAGLSAARMLASHGHACVVLEARDRVGGRVHTDGSSLSVPVDMGASIITGCAQRAKRS